MGLFKKTVLVPSEEEQELEGVETWIVRWNSWNCKWKDYHLAEKKQECQAFTNHDDALKFKEALENAYKLTKRNAGNEILVEKQECGL